MPPSMGTQGGGQQLGVPVPPPETGGGTCANEFKTPNNNTKANSKRMRILFFMKLNHANVLKNPKPNKIYFKKLYLHD